MLSTTTGRARSTLTGYAVRVTTDGVVTGGSVRLVAGRYQLQEMLGRGGMGCVWRAEDQLLRRPVAVKEIAFPPSLREDELAILRERTLREARAAARIDSSSAVRVYDVVEDDGRPCIVMELVEGRTLRDVIRQDGPLTCAQTARVGLALVDALESAHAAGIVHRDVKPGNVLVRIDGRVILTDFGIARTAGDSSITSTGLLLGSPSYISPERARGGEPLPASDMWSLGATLYTAVEGRPPFDRGEPFSTLAAVVGEPPGDYLAAGPLAPLIDRLLDKEPAGRPTPAQARRLLGPIAADPANDRTAAAGTAAATAALAPAEETIVLPPAPRATAPVTASAPVRPPAASGSSVSPVPASPRRGDRRSERLAGGLAVLLLLLGLGTVAAVLFLRGNPKSPAEGQQTSPTPSAGSPAASRSPAAPVVVPPPAIPPRSAGTPTPTNSRPPSTSGTGVPPNWVRFTAPAGWSFAHPADWRPRARRGGTDYVDPATTRYVRVDSQSPAVASSLAALSALEARFKSEHRNYSRIRLGNISVPGYDDAAIWEWTYRDGSTTLHAVDLSLTSGDRSYALLFQARDSDWAGSEDEIKAFFASFRPVL